MRAPLVALVVLILASCNMGPSASAPTATGPVCTHDEDCQIGACGPCEANALITSEALAQECVVNPCPASRAYCTPAHTCAVR